MHSVVKAILKDLALLLLAGAMAGGSGLGPLSARPAWAATTEQGPTEVVGHFHSVLLDAAHKSGAANYDARYQKLDPVVRRSFDFAYIGQTVLGAYWSKLSPQQQALFVERFARNTVATYAGQFNSFSGERFTPAGEQAPRPDLRVVRADLVTGDGDTHRFAYLMRRTGQSWRVANILVDNVSQMAVQRSEYTSILRDQGFDTLISRLETQTSRMKQTS